MQKEEKGTDAYTGSEEYYTLAISYHILTA